VRKTYWVYTDQSLFELNVGNEDRDVWKINLEKENFDVALTYAKARDHRNFSLLSFNIFGGIVCRTERSHLSSLRTGIIQVKAVLPGSASLRSMLDTIRGCCVEIPRRQRTRRVEVIHDVAVRTNTQVGLCQILRFLSKTYNGSRT
jgi:hypothetical protein